MMRWRRTIVVAGVAVLTLGCRDTTGTRPASVAGNWSWYSGVDFAASFTLNQQGSVVTGELVYILCCGLDTAAVTGSVNGRFVLLQWSRPFGAEIDHTLLRGELSPDGQSITAAVSVNGGDPSPMSTLHRAGQPN